MYKDTVKQLDDLTMLYIIFNGNWESVLETLNEKYSNIR